MPIRWLDIGSGRNPFYFSPPQSVTVNKKTALTGDWFIDSYFPDPHINASAQSLRFRPCSVENVLFHYSVGFDASCVITPPAFAKIARRAHSWLIPGGSIIVRSSFHGTRCFDPRPFYRGLRDAGFSGNEIDLVVCSDTDRLPPAAKEVLLYCDHHDERSADSSSSLLIATKGDS
jgi:hypothetical protein